MSRGQGAPVRSVDSTAVVLRSNCLMQHNLTKRPFQTVMYLCGQTSPENNHIVRRIFSLSKMVCGVPSDDSRALSKMDVCQFIKCTACSLLNTQ